MPTPSLDTSAMAELEVCMGRGDSSLAGTLRFGWTSRDSSSSETRSWVASSNRATLEVKMSPAELILGTERGGEGGREGEGTETRERGREGRVGGTARRERGREGGGGQRGVRIVYMSTSRGKCVWCKHVWHSLHTCKYRTV